MPSAQQQSVLPRRRRQFVAKLDVAVETTPSRKGSKSRYHVRSLSKRILFPILAMPLLCLLNGIAYYAYWRVEGIFLSYDGFVVGANSTVSAVTSPARPVYYFLVLCNFFYLVLGNVFIVRPGVSLLVAEMMEHHREELANHLLLKFALLTAILGAPHAAVSALRDSRVPRDDEGRALPVTNSGEGIFVMLVLGTTWGMVIFSLWLWWTSMWVNKLASGVRRFADRSLAERRQMAEEELRLRLAGSSRPHQPNQFSRRVQSTTTTHPSRGLEVDPQEEGHQDRVDEGEDRQSVQQHDDDDDYTTNIRGHRTDV